MHSYEVCRSHLLTEMDLLVDTALHEFINGLTGLQKYSMGPRCCECRMLAMFVGVKVKEMERTASI
jgi:hypothetical protein